MSPKLGAPPIYLNLQSHPPKTGEGGRKKRREAAHAHTNLISALGLKLQTAAPELYPPPLVSHARPSHPHSPPCEDAKAGSNSPGTIPFPPDSCGMRACHRALSSTWCHSAEANQEEEGVGTSWAHWELQQPGQEKKPGGPAGARQRPTAHLLLDPYGIFGDAGVYA